MFAVICIIDIDPEFLDGFLRETYDAYPEAAQYLCLVTTLDASAYKHNESRYSAAEAKRQGSVVQTHGNGPMTVPSRPPWTTVFTSPFKKASMCEAAKAIRSEYANTELDQRYCVILDQRSLLDRTAVLVELEGEGGLEARGFPRHTRQPFSEANVILEAIISGAGGSFDELLWNSRE